MTGRKINVYAYDLAVGDVIVEDLGDPCAITVVAAPVVLGYDEGILVRVSEFGSEYELVFGSKEIKKINREDKPR